MGLILIWGIVLLLAAWLFWRRVRSVDDNLRSKAALREAQFLASLPKSGKAKPPQPSE